MLTPKLEELILCGKAFFKTAVVGGSKTTIDIDNDRFIIITDITYLGYNNQTFTQNDDVVNTQVSIYGERGFNHYIFRNKGIQESYVSDGGGGAISFSAQQALPPQRIDTYLLHTTQVGFSFINSVRSPNATSAIAAANNPAFEPPLDYGKDGMPGAIVVDNDLSFSVGFNNQIVNRLTGLGIGSNITQQIQFGAELAAAPVVLANNYLPICNVNYVEILGQPNNIGI